MTDPELEKEREYRIQERLGMICGAGEPTPEQQALAEAEADRAITALRQVRGRQLFPAKALFCVLLLLGAPALAQLHVRWTPPTNMPPGVIWEVWTSEGNQPLGRSGTSITNSFTIPTTPTNQTMVLVFGRADGFAWPAASTNWSPLWVTNTGNLLFSRTNLVTMTNLVTQTNLVTLTNFLTWTNLVYVTNYVTITNLPGTNLPPILPTIVNGTFTNGSVGWTATGIVDFPTAYSAARFNSGQRTPGGQISQKVVTEPGQVYTLGYAAGIIAYQKWPQAIQVIIQGGTNVPAVLTQAVTTLLPPPNFDLVYTNRTISFRADSPQTTIIFRDASTYTDSVDCFVDNVAFR